MVCNRIFICNFAMEIKKERMPDNKKNRALDNNYAHMQPQAVDIERIVLGALMIDKDAFSVVSEILHPETFYEPRNQKVYSAIQSLSLDEKPVDIMTVAEELKRQGTLEDVGGPAYVLELSSHVASSAHIEYHAKILAQKFLARQLISFASVIETKAFDETTDVDELMQEAEGSLFELSRKNMRQDYTQIDPVVKQAVEILQKAAANKGGLTGIPTGYTLSLAKNIAVDYGRPIAFFSLEMNNVQLVNRLISNVCEIEGRKILNGQLDDEEWKRLDLNVGKLQAAPIYIDDTPGMSIFELRTKARRLVREKGVELIMVDYLQLMNASGARFGSRQEEVSTISRSLKGLAKELDIPVLALSQLNRTVEGREGPEGKRPQLSDLRESGAIEQDADMVLFVHRPEYYRIFTDEKGNDLHGKAQIIIAKHRKGGTGDVLLNFRGEFTRFENPNDSNNAPFGGGEIIGSRINGDDSMPMPPPYGDGMPADGPLPF